MKGWLLILFELDEMIISIPTVHNDSYIFRLATFFIIPVIFLYIAAVYNTKKLYIV